MAKTVEEVAFLAAAWWGELVKNPNHNKGNSKKKGTLGDVIDENLRLIPLEVQGVFVDKLTSAILSGLETQDQVYLATSNNSDYLLTQVAYQARVPAINFPNEAAMEISLYHVACIAENGQPIQMLYMSKGYWQKRIEWEQETVEEYKKRLLNATDPLRIMLAQKVIDEHQGIINKMKASMAEVEE